MARKDITIDDLAVMVKSGFDETAKKKDVDEQLGRIGERLGRVEEKVDNIEKLILKQHTFEIQDLKKRMKRMEDLFAMK